MFEIKTLNKISASGLSLLDPGKYTVGDDLSEPDAILVRSAKMHDMAVPASLKAVARAGAGTNNIPVAEYAKQGIVVFNTPGANANAVKELVLASLLLSSRRIVPGIEWVKTLSGQGDGVAAAVEKGKSAFAGPELKGKTLGVIGLGAIGCLVANTAVHLGMKVYGYDPYLSVEGAWNLSHHIVHVTDVNDIYQNSDYITLHVPATPDTTGAINAETLSLMRDGVRIINMARGELVDVDALLAALESGKVASYITDFASDALIGAEGVICMPHLGASTPESEDNCAAMAAEELIDFLENGNIRNSVNMPAASMARTAGTKRLCIIHYNIPNMIASISAVLSDAGANIENMVDKGRKDYAYSLIDVSDVPDNIGEKLMAIDGVIRIRVI